MMDTIISWIYTALGNAFDWIFSAFLQSLDLDLGKYISIFPIAITAYHMFRILAVGIVALLAVFQLFKFFAGPLAETRDTPGRIAVRSALAVFMIYFGGYFIEWIVNLAKTPYDAFIALDGTVGNTTFSLGDLVSGIATGAFAAGGMGIGFLSMTGQALISLILALIIAWNLLKLIVEVAERFLMVGTLAYIAPLPFATLCSQATSQIFSRYIQMFAGQCVLMTLSVWSLKLILSAFGSIQSSQSAWPIALLLVLAMCRIAQRMDTYMQQLGIGVGTTGGSLLDELLNMGRTYAQMTRGHDGNGGGNRKENVLGATTDAAGKVKPDVSGYGVLGALKGGLRAGSAAFKKGATVGDTFKAAGKGAVDGSKYGGDGVKGAVKKAAAATVAGRAGINAMSERLNSMKPVTAAVAGAAYKTADGKSVLNDTAKNQGISFNKKTGAVEGKNTKAVGDYIAANADREASYDAIAETMKNGDPAVAASAIFGNHNDLTHDPDKSEITQDQHDKMMSDGLNSMFNGKMAEMNDPDNLKNATVAEKNVAAVGAAMAASMEGDKLSGSLSDVRKQTTKEGGHIVSANVKDAAGNKVGQFHVADENAFRHMTANQKAGFVPMTDATGATYYAKASTGEMKIEDFGKGKTVASIPGSMNGQNQPLDLSSKYEGMNLSATANGIQTKGDAGIITTNDGKKMFTGANSGVVGSVTGEGYASQSKEGIDTANNTVLNSKDFNQEAAQSALSSMAQNGVKMNPQGLKTDSVEGVTRAKESAQAVAKIATAAYGTEAIQQSFANAASEANIPISKRDASRISEAFTDAASGQTSGASTISGIEADGDTIKGEFNNDNQRYGFTIRRNEDGSPEVAITGYGDRPTEKNPNPPMTQVRESGGREPGGSSSGGGESSVSDTTPPGKNAGTPTESVGASPSSATTHGTGSAHAPAPASSSAPSHAPATAHQEVPTVSQPVPVQPVVSPANGAKQEAAPVVQVPVNNGTGTPSRTDVSTTETKVIINGHGRHDIDEDGVVVVLGDDRNGKGKRGEDPIKDAEKRGKGKRTLGDDGKRK